jgi:hypothetical protein
MNWFREVAEQNPNQSAIALDALLKVARKLAQEVGSQTSVIYEVPPGMWLEFARAISSDVKLSDCRFAFKQLLGREGEPLGSPLVSFLRGVRYLSTPFFDGLDHAARSIG